MALPDKPLAGKVALVTGGSRGIGAGIARKLAAWGCELWINYVQHTDAAESLAAELRRGGAAVHLHCADVAAPSEIAAMLAAVGERHGHLDILVDNAAGAVFGRLDEASLKHWQWVMDTNARATLLLAQHARPLMAGRGARLITITNSMPERYVPGAGLLAASKAAVETLTRYLSVELAADGIVANCLRPGLVRTDILRVRPELAAVADRLERESPWGRITTPADCGDVVALLCLDEAKWICGQIIDVDGGTMLR